MKKKTIRTLALISAISLAGCSATHTTFAQDGKTPTSKTVVPWVMDVAVDGKGGFSAEPNAHFVDKGAEVTGALGKQLIEKAPSAFVAITESMGEQQKEVLTGAPQDDKATVVPAR